MESRMAAVDIALNVLAGVAFFAIAGLIARGLVQTGQTRNNPLALATVAIFVACAGGKLVQALTVATSGSDAGPYVITWDVLTLAVAVTFITMRRRYRT